MAVLREGTAESSVSVSPKFLLSTHFSNGVSGARLKRCNMNDQFGWFIQGLLAFVAFSTLICKYEYLCICSCSL